MNHIETAKEVFDVEINGLEKVKNSIGKQFEQAIELISVSEGRVIICGMGKSGLIGKKIAATLASTGTPSYFLHPGEAFHGDLGMVKPEDVFVGISYSGETEELIRLLPFLRNNKNRLIAITGNQSSTLSKNADVHLDVAVDKEACPHQLAPTSSTTATLVIGDALAVSLMKLAKFEPADFAVFHPGGALGRKLLSKARDEMISKDLPLVHPHHILSQVISVMTKGSIGVAVVDNNDGAFGLITDGDLRRAFKNTGAKLDALTAKDIMTSHPINIYPDMPMSEAWEVMEKEQVTSLLVTENGKLLGVVKK